MNTYSFRAECQHDVNMFLNVCGRRKIFLTVTISNHPKEPHLADRYVELTTDTDIRVLRNAMRCVANSHVMVETLKQCLAKENSLKRNYDFK